MPENDMSLDVKNGVCVCPRCCKRREHNTKEVELSGVAVFAITVVAWLVVFGLCALAAIAFM